MVTLTDTAVAQVKSVQAADAAFAGKALRVAVKEGGCAGYSYAFQFDDARNDDARATFDGVTVVVDPQSLPLFDGCAVTWEQKGLAAGSFRVTNPNATGDCGCGESFSVAPSKAGPPASG